MYSGNDTVDYPTQWALNPVAYQDMANDQVDWAALAQQWIQMKETTPAPVVQVPPPPIISLSAIEGGEAPMDMEGGPEPPAPPTIPPQQWGNTPDPNWGNSWNQWGSWGWPSTPAAGSKPPLMPTPDPPYSGYSTGDNNFTGYTTGTGSNMAPGYWAGTTEEARSRAPRRHSPPAPRHTTRRPPRPHPSPVPPPGIIPEDTTQTIDAAKRRSLPAWIREGLEKMEREKQKQLDKEREQKEREEYLRLKKLEEERAGQEPDDGLPKLPAKSKFDSDSDGSDTESKMDKVAEKIDNETVKEPPPMLQKSQEEIMQDVMLNVRRTLTEILLEVTTEQILSVCKEELGRNRSHPQASLGASVASKSQALSAIGGGLGLGIYGDSSDSGSDSEESSSRTPERHQDEDITDGQLQDTIRRRKAEFEKTTREIEARIAEEEAQLQRAPSGGGPAPPPLSRHPRPAPPPPHSNAQESSASDGEGTTSNNRKEQNNSHHKKFIQENTPPPLVDGKKTKSVSEKTSRSERGSKDSIDKKIKTHNSIERKDKNSKKSYKEKERKHERDSSKKKVIKSPKKSSPDEQSDSEESSSESSGSSDSDTDSFLNDKPVAHSRRSRSSGSSNSGSSGGSSSSSDVRSVSQHSHSKKKKSKSSSERRKSKKSKKDKRKSKKEDRHKIKKVDTDDFDEVETPSRRRDHDYKRQDSVARESHKSSRHSTRTPERVSHKSKYSHRSRSKSDDRSYKKYKKYDSREDDAHSRDRRSGERRDRSRDRRGRSREKRGRSREDRDWRDRSRGGRDRSKDRWERAREDRRDRKESRSYY